MYMVTQNTQSHTAINLSPRLCGARFHLQINLLDYAAWAAYPVPTNSILTATYGTLQILYDDDDDDDDDDDYARWQLTIRATINRPISREWSSSPNLVSDQAAHPVCDQCAPHLSDSQVAAVSAA